MDQQSPAQSDLNLPPRAASPPERLLLLLIVIWLIALTAFVTVSRPRVTTPAENRLAAPTAELDLADCVIGMQLLEMDDARALTPEQAQRLLPMMDAIALHLGKSDTSPQARDMLRAYLIQSVLTPAQTRWIGQQKEILLAASTSNPWAAQTRMLAALQALVRLRAGQAGADKVATSGTPALLSGNDVPEASPSASTTTALTRAQLMRGLLRLETDRTHALSPAQARAIQRLLAPSLQVKRVEALMDEPVPASLLDVLSASQRAWMQAHASGALTLDGKTLADADLCAAVEQLLQARERGQHDPLRLALAESTDLPLVAPSLAADAGRTPPPSPSSTTSPVGGVGIPTVSPSLAPVPVASASPTVVSSRLRLRGVNSLVFTQVLFGIVALENDPKVAITPAQAVKLREALPAIARTLEQMKNRVQPQEVASVEKLIKETLRDDQKLYIAANVPESGPMDALFPRLQSLVTARAAQK